MIYHRIVEGTFLERCNRFIAMVEINGQVERVHVRNTGRCKELLIPGVKVYLEPATQANRKTQYSLVSVYKGSRLINLDSQIPNPVVHEAVLSGKVKEIGPITQLKREVFYMHSRFDLYYEAVENKGFIEVKGVTLERDGHVFFPDAPTDRGRKHLEEMVLATKNGYKNYVLFLVQMEGVESFAPNYETDPAFAQALQRAHIEGVTVLCYDSIVTREGITLNEPVKIQL